MKTNCLVILGACFVTCLGNALGAADQNAPQHPKLSFDKAVDTDWQGVKFIVPYVRRLDSENVLVVVRVKAGQDASHFAAIAGPPSASNPMAAAPLSLGASPAKKSANNLPLPPKDNPFSIEPATLQDQLTQATFSTVPESLGLPYYGPSSILTTLFPTQWVQLSIQFKLPAPQPQPDGTIPVQKVDITLPKAKGPIRSIIVPPLQAK